MAVKKKKPQKKTPDKINPDTGLSARQEEFARQYIYPTATDFYPTLKPEDKPFNGTRAAIRAGYAERSARITASQLLTKPNIQLYMSQIQKPAMDKFNITQERILQEMAALAFSNILDFVQIDEKTGQAWVDISKCTREQAAALSGFEVIEMPPVQIVEGGQEITREVLKHKIKLYDKKPVLEMLAKRENMLGPDTLDINVRNKMDDDDRMELAKSIAFMLRRASEDKKRREKVAKMGPAKATVKKESA